MKSLKFVPSVCKEKTSKEGRAIPPTFSGHIMISVPPFEKRYQLIEDSGFETDQDGEIRSTMKKLGPLVRLAKGAEDLITHIEITKLANEDEPEVHFRHYKELFDDPDCDPILFEIGALVLGGFRVSKN